MSGSEAELSDGEEAAVQANGNKAELHSTAAPALPGYDGMRICLCVLATIWQCWLPRQEDLCCKGHDGM